MLLVASTLAFVEIANAGVAAAEGADYSVRMPEAPEGFHQRHVRRIAPATVRELVSAHRQAWAERTRGAGDSDDHDLGLGFPRQLMEPSRAAEVRVARVCADVHLAAAARLLVRGQPVLAAHHAASARLGPLQTHRGLEEAQLAHPELLLPGRRQADSEIATDAGLLPAVQIEDAQHYLLLSLIDILQRAQTDHQRGKSLDELTAILELHDGDYGVSTVPTNRREQLQIVVATIKDPQMDPILVSRLRAADDPLCSLEESRQRMYVLESSMQELSLAAKALLDQSAAHR